MASAIKRSPGDCTYEEVFEALDRFQRNCATTCEVRMRPILGGTIVTLYQGGNPIAQGRGTHSDEALAAALDDVGAL